jgi:amidase
LSDEGDAHVRVHLDDVELAREDILKWIFHATLSGNPASVCPIGRTAEGLPCGIQIMGPFLEDATPIDLAGRIAEFTGGFVAPPLA